MYCRRMRVARFIPPLILLFAAYWAFRFAYAEYAYRSGDFQRAAALVPFHPEYQARIGNLRGAVELNPYFSAAWLELAFNLEQEGKFGEAEQCLRQAAKV